MPAGCAFTALVTREKSHTVQKNVISKTYKDCTEISVFKYGGTAVF